MSLQPILYNIDTFDARKGTTIKFTWQGGSLKSNQLVFYDSSGKQLEYSPIYNSFKGIHVLPPNSYSGGSSQLFNNTKYSVKVIVTTQNDETFESPIKVFRTVLTPTFNFTGVTDGFVVNGTSINLRLNYYQEHGEKLNTWRAYLYDAAKNQISMSDEKLATKSMNSLFSGLADKTEYYVRAIGETVNGLHIDTGYFRILVNYSIQEIFLNLDLTNKPLDGGIYIDSNIVTIDGEVTPAELYIENELGDLSVINLKDAICTYTEGFNFNEDFTMRMNVSFYNIPHFKPFLTLKGKRDDGVDQSYVFYNWFTTVNVNNTDVEQHQIYVECLSGVGENIFKYGLWSNYLTKEQMDSCHEHIGIIFKRINGIFDLRIIPLADYEPLKED